MSRENQDLVLAWTARYNARELDAAVGCCTEDLRVAPDRSVFPEGEPFVGRERYRSFLEETWAAWSGNSATVAEMLDLDDGRVLVRYDWRAVGTTSGIEMNMSLSTIWSFRDGMVASTDYFFDHDKALKAVGLEEAVSEGSTMPDLVELVRRFNDAWNRRDADAFLSVLAPEVVYRPIATWPEPHERRGSDEVRRFFIHDSSDAWTDDFISKPETIREYGGGVIALLRFSGHAKTSGVEIGGGVFRVFRFRDAQIAQVEDFTDRDEARAAAERLAAERG